MSQQATTQEKLEKLWAQFKAHPLYRQMSVNSETMIVDNVRYRELHPDGEGTYRFHGECVIMERPSPQPQSGIKTHYTVEQLEELLTK